MIIYLIGFLIPFIAVLIISYVMNNSIVIRDLLIAIAAGLVSYVAVVVLIVVGIVLFHEHALDKGWYDIKIF
jgi:uncharacterized membrane protein